MIREWTRADTVAFLHAPTADDDKYSRGVVALRTGSRLFVPYGISDSSVGFATVEIDTLLQLMV